MQKADKSKSSKEYIIVLTQSQKKIHKSQRKSYEAITNFDNLRLKKASSFWSLQDDFFPIYDHFNLTSYLSPRCQAEIFTRVYGDQFTFRNADLFRLVKKGKLLMIERSRDQLKDVLPTQEKPFEIIYELITPATLAEQLDLEPDKAKIKQFILKLDQLLKEKSVKSFKISVKVYTKVQKMDEPQFILCHMRNKKQVFEETRESIHIKITDEQDWLSSQFDINYDHRISQIRKSKVGEVQYFYLQPKDQRQKHIEKQHISLALQGGGCKGVQYIGAYKAILQNSTKPITSIIGSSAGSILGLAICLKLKPEEIEQLCVQKLSKVANDKKYEHIDKEGEHFLEQTHNKIYDFLKNFNILEPQFIDIIMNCLADKQVQQSILELIEAATNSEIQKLFLDQSIDKNNKVTKRLNLLGLLNGSLMKGNVIKDIAVTCITIFLSRYQKQSPEAFSKLRNSDKNKSKNIYQVAEGLTMRQLYEMTSVEFTCTAVDINNQILRFLNQKTTPHLPVCKAVQMSGSFPVAFEAQTWQSHWGKYYIHYDNLKKQIDLTGCQLTDGGTLANFPVKYLDNQDMRPMYFSHAKTSSTIMYGIGLISDVPKDIEKEKKVEQAMKKLGTKLFKVIGICGPLSSWVLSKLGCREPKQQRIQINSQNPFSVLTQIPIVKFGLKLFLTYSTTKDNLTQECFSHSAYETPARTCIQNEVKNRPSNPAILHNLKNLSNRINNELIQRQKESGSSLLQTFCSNLKYLVRHQEVNMLNQKHLCEVTSILYEIVSNFLHFLTKQRNFGTRHLIVLRQKYVRNGIVSKDVGQNLIIKGVLRKISQVFRSEIFVLCSLKSDFELLSKIVDALIDFAKQINQQTKIVDSCLAYIRQRQQHHAVQILDALKQNTQSPNQQINLKRKTIYEICNLSALSVTNSILNIVNAQKAVKQCQVPQIFVHEEAESHRQFIKAYAFKRIINYFNKSSLQNRLTAPDGLHLVLQSVALSELYFHQYYLVVRDALLQFNASIRNSSKLTQPAPKNSNDHISDQVHFNKQLKISTMTATGFHSLVIFLHASDLPEERINNEVWKIRDLIKMNKQKLNQKYETADWSKLTPILLRQIHKQAVSKKKDIFSYIEQDIIKDSQKYNNQISKIKSVVEKKMEQVRFSNEDLINSIQTSLGYIVNTLMQIQNEAISPDKMAQTLQERLVLAWNQHQEPALVRAECSLTVKNIIGFFYEKYKDIVQFIALSSPFMIDQIIKILKPEERKEVWKGIILSQFLSIDHIKNYVQRILLELKLDKNTTLKQFYDFSAKKIQINFSVVEENLVAIYNHKTRPNMPLWAAIVASSSIPQFFPPLLDRPQWRQKEQKNYAKRNVTSYFEDSQHPYKFITSSEALTRLPLDLLQNNKYQKQITDKRNEIFLVFNFGELKFKSIFNDPIKQFTVKSLTLGQCITKFLSFKSLIYKPYEDKQKKRRKLYEEQKNLKGVGMFFNLPMLTVKKKLLNLYIESHDNLIIKLYKRELIQMPIRFDTLDFHLMTQKTKGQKQRLSDVCQDAIMQAQYIITEKITNRYIAQDQSGKSGMLASKKQVNFKSEKGMDEIQGQDLAKYSENSKRVIYFRVQSAGTGQRHINSRKKFSNDVCGSQKGKLTKISNNFQDQQSSKLSIAKQQVHQKNDNVLNIRILSMLNPSRELYEKYYIYYPSKYEDSYEKQKYNSDGFIRIKTQSKQIDFQAYQQDNHLELRIQYPSSDQTQIRTVYFKVTLDKLFALNRELIQKKQAARFGFIYSIQFDQIYSDHELRTVGKWKQDYMNVNLKLQQSPTVGIISNIQNTYHRSVLCEYCVTQLRLKKTSDASQQKVYFCEKCKRSDKIANRFTLSYNPKKDVIECAMSHQIIGHFFDGQSKDENPLHPDCNICGKSCNIQYWEDPECQLIFCEVCRRKNIQK